MLLRTSLGSNSSKGSIRKHHWGYDLHLPLPSPISYHRARTTSVFLSSFLLLCRCAGWRYSSAEEVMVKVVLLNFWGRPWDRNAATALRKDLNAMYVATRGSFTISLAMSSCGLSAV